MFRVGQKVTQIAPHTWGSSYGETHPQFGAVYTIRAINSHRDDTYLHFFEIKNPIHSYSDGTFEMDYWAKKFRPIVERKTSISFAHEILRKASRRIEA